MRTIRFRPVLERLEAIIAPASASAKVSGGVLKITGTNLDEAVGIMQTGPGSLDVLISSEKGDQEYSFQRVMGLSVDLKGGNDVCNIGTPADEEATAFGKNASITLGAGDDELRIEGSLSVGGSLTVKAGAGANTISQDAAGLLKVGGKLTIDLGTGRKEADEGEVFYFGSSLFLGGISVGRAATIKAGGKADHDVRLGGAEEDGAAAVDVNGTFTVQLGSGNDFLQINNLKAKGRASIGTGAGDDSVFLAGAGTTAGARSAVNGGGGDNGINASLDLDPDTLFAKIRLTKIELNDEITFQSF